MRGREGGGSKWGIGRERERERKGGREGGGEGRRERGGRKGERGKERGRKKGILDLPIVWLYTVTYMDTYMYVHQLPTFSSLTHHIILAHILFYTTQHGDLLDHGVNTVAELPG